MERFRAGEVRAEDIDDYIDAWSTGSSNLQLDKFLGMSKEEYERWLRDPDALREMK